MKEMNVRYQKQGKYTDAVDDILVKIISAKKKKFKMFYTED